MPLPVLLMAGAALASSTSWPDLSEPPRRSGQQRPQDAALVVSIEEYTHTFDVAGAAANGAAWSAWLREGLGVSVVKELRDQEATKAEILAAASEVGRRVGDDGRVWVVFIGHGAPATGGSEGLLLDVDVHPTARSIAERGLSRGDLLAALRTHNSAVETVLVLDACFSGRLEGGDALAPGLQPLVPTQLVTPVGATVLTAARADQFAGALSDGSRPAFSYLALGALRGWADENLDGKVTSEETVRYVDDALFQTTTGRAQTPTLTGADLVLAAGVRESGPKLDILAHAAPAAVVPVAVSTSGGGGLSSSDIAELEAAQRDRLAAEARERALREKLRKERTSKMTAARDQERGEATREWESLANLRGLGGPEAERAVRAYARAWSDVSVVVKDVEGTHVQAVTVPEMRAAERWLAAQAPPKVRTAADKARTVKALGWTGAALGVGAGSWALVSGLSLESTLQADVESGALDADGAAAVQAQANSRYALGYAAIGVGVASGVFLGLRPLSSAPSLVVGGRF